MSSITNRALGAKEWISVKKAKLKRLSLKKMDQMSKNQNHNSKSHKYLFTKLKNKKNKKSKRNSRNSKLYLKERTHPKT
jgi:hypothetical protein